MEGREKKVEEEWESSGYLQWERSARSRRLQERLAPDSLAPRRLAYLRAGGGNVRVVRVGSLLEVDAPEV